MGHFILSIEILTISIVLKTFSKAVYDDCCTFNSGPSLFTVTTPEFTNVFFYFFKVKENQNATDIDIKTNGTVLGLKSKPYTISYHAPIDFAP